MMPVDNIENLLSNTVSNSWTIQGFVYKNGQILFMLWATAYTQGSSPMASAIPVVLDISTKKAFVLSYDGIPYACAEIECICKDPDNDSIYWTLFALDANGLNDGTRSVIVKHSFDERFVGANNYINKSIGQAGDRAYADIYVDEHGAKSGGTYTFDYIADGSGNYPFKTLDSAIICGSIASSHIRFRIQGGDYYIGTYNFASCFIHLIGQTGSPAGVTVHGRINAGKGSLVQLSYITLINDYTGAEILNIDTNGSVFLENVNFTRSEKGSVGIVSYGNLSAIGVSFDKLYECVQLFRGTVNGFGNVSVKDCSLVFHVYGNCEVVQERIFRNVVFETLASGSDTRKLIVLDKDCWTPVIKMTAHSTNYIEVFDYLKKRVYVEDVNKDNTGGVEVFIRGNINTIYNTETKEYHIYESRTLEQNEILLTISRGRYYYNGSCLVSMTGNNGFFGLSNSNYARMPKDGITAGTIFYDSTRIVAALYRGDDTWLKLLTSMARQDATGLDGCIEGGFYFISDYNTTLDLGGTAKDFFVLNIGRAAVCQIVLQWRGTKIGVRYRAEQHGWYDWVIFNGTQLT